MAPPNNGPAFGPRLYTQITGSCLGAGPVTAPCQSSLLTVQMNNAALLQPLNLSEGSGTEAELAELPRLQGTWIPGPEMFRIGPPCWGVGSLSSTSLLKTQPPIIHNVRET